VPIGGRLEAGGVRPPHHPRHVAPVSSCNLPVVAVAVPGFCVVGSTAEERTIGDSLRSPHRECSTDYISCNWLTI
jgi:hypothetical protein